MTGAGRVSDRQARNAVGNVWRAFRAAPRTVRYPVLGTLLALATATVLLFALGLPGTAAGKTFFLVVAYSVVAAVALLGYMLGGSFDESQLGGKR